MTLGQKLKALLKGNNMTQEDLAERLDVSRQAVGKWVNDKGIPEVGKLVQISRLFGVSTDYLLKEECEEKSALMEKTMEENGESESGFYVSQEMLGGYLLYCRRKVRWIAGGISLFMLSNIFDCFGSDSIMMSLLYWLTMMAGIAIVLLQFFQIGQYQKIKNEHLIFDDKVYEDFKKQRESRRKKYAFAVIAGVAVLMASSEMQGVLTVYLGQTVCEVLEWAADMMWIALIIWAGMSMHADSIVVKNTEYFPQSGNMKRYRWVYMALPVTAAAVWIGIVTNAWSPYAPIIILFCCLLVTTCKLLIEK